MTDNDAPTLSVVSEGKRDEDVAADLAARMRTALGPVCAIVAEGRSVNMDIQFAVGSDMLGRVVVQRLAIAKVLVI